jgi:hypothetical protein
MVQSPGLPIKLAEWLQTSSQSPEDTVVTHPG